MMMYQRGNDLEVCIFIPSFSRESQKTELPRNVAHSHCMVCGDIADGYHYDVASCNGCKTFFRRSILHDRKYTCKKDGKCFATYPKGELRCACRECRLNKCFEVGMNASAIKVDQKASVSVKTNVMNAIVNKRTLQNNSIEPAQAKIMKVIPHHIFSVQDRATQTIDELYHLEAKYETFRRSNYNPDFKNWSLDSVINQVCSLDIADRYGKRMAHYPVYVAFKCLTFDEVVSFTSVVPEWPLKEIPFPEFLIEEARKYPDERQRWKRLTEVYHEYFQKHWLFFDLFGSVEYAKAFPFYRHLSSQDKKDLLRSVSLTCCNLTQAFHSYSMNSNVIIHPDGSKPFAFWDDEAWPDFHIALMKKFHRKAIDCLNRVKLTKTEYSLIKPILLCNAGTLDLSKTGKSAVLQEQRRITDALLNLCLNTYGIHGPSRFATIIAIVEVLERMSQEQRDFHHIMKFRRPKDRKGHFRFIEEITDI